MTEYAIESLSPVYRNERGAAVRTATIMLNTVQSFSDGSGAVVEFATAYGPDPDGYVNAGGNCLTVPAGKGGRHEFHGQAAISIGTGGTTPDRTDIIAMIVDLDDFTTLGYARVDLYAATNSWVLEVYGPPVDLVDGQNIGMFVSASALSLGFGSGSTGTGGTDTTGGGGGVPFTFLSIHRLA